MRYHLTPVKIVIISKSTNKCWWGCGKGILFQCWWEWRLVWTLWKAAWRYFKKLKLELSYDPVIPLLGMYLKKRKTLIQKNICTPMFIEALLIIAKIWKRLRCPSVDIWIKKAVVHLHNGIVLGHKKGTLTFCNSRDRPGEYYAKWNKPLWERRIPYDLTYMWNLMNKIS